MGAAVLSSKLPPLLIKDRSIWLGQYVLNFHSCHVLVTFSDKSPDVSPEAIKTCNQMKCISPLNKIRIHLCLNIAGNISDEVSTQLNKTYNIKCVIIVHFNAELLHSISWNVMFGMFSNLDLSCEILEYFFSSLALEQLCEWIRGLDEKCLLAGTANRLMDT